MLSIPHELAGRQTRLVLGEVVVGSESSPLGSVLAWLRFTQSRDERTRARLARWSRVGGRWLVLARTRLHVLRMTVCLGRLCHVATGTRGRRHLSGSFTGARGPAAKAPSRCCLTARPRGHPGSANDSRSPADSARGHLWADRHAPGHNALSRMAPSPTSGWTAEQTFQDLPSVVHTLIHRGQAPQCPPGTAVRSITV